MKKILAILLSVIMIASLFTVIPVSALSNDTLNFEFSKTQPMTKEVLRNYLSRAVTLQGFTIENNSEDLIFEEDLRMIQRIGAKFIGRSAFYSWAGQMSADEIANHYEVAAEKAAAVHTADPDIILQAGIFEIAWKKIIENTAIPAYVFQAFGQPVVARNFDWDMIVFPAGTKDPDGIDRGPGFWDGNPEAGIPDITKLETQMYFYYQITKYIDAGYEAIHMGQVEMMMCFNPTAAKISCWRDLLTKGRDYAETHARRGVVLFDCHVTKEGIKDGNNLIFDFFGASIKPNETVAEDGALKCEVLSYGKTNTSTTYMYSYIGRMVGGTHPLGFNMEQSFTLCEFDNFVADGVEHAGIANYGKDCGNWGMDDITWFATQPDWYRREFLKEVDNYLCTHNLDSDGNFQYFLQPQLRRIITPDADYGFDPTVTYTPGANLSTEFVYDYADKEGNFLEYDKNNGSYKFHIGNSDFYRANRNSDACPNGYSDEDTIRELFVGAGFPDTEHNEVNVPAGYVLDKDTTADKIYVKDFTVRSRKSDVKDSTDKVMDEIDEVLQGEMIDLWDRSDGSAPDISHLELKNGQYAVLRLEVEDIATSLKIQNFANFNVNSAQKFKIELSADKSTYYTLVDYAGGVDNDNIESIIAPQFEKTKGASAFVLSKAEKVNGKKVVYLRISTYADGGQIRIRSFDVAITRNAEIPYTTVAKQKFIADTVCQSGWEDHNDSNPNCFEKYVVRDHSDFDQLAHMIKLWNLGGHVVFHFDLEDTATSFNPYLYVAGDKTAKIKIMASRDNMNWLEIVPATEVVPTAYQNTYGELGTIPWPSINEENIKAVLTDNDAKNVYLKYEYAGIGSTGDEELQLQHFGISAEYVRDLKSEAIITDGEYYVADVSTSDYWDADDTSPYYFDNFVSMDYSDRIQDDTIRLNYWQRDLVAKFDIDAASTSFMPYIALNKVFDENSTDVKSITIQASANGTDGWVDIVTAHPITVGAWGDILYNDVAPFAWSSINSDNVANVLLAAPAVDGKKSVYLKYSFAGQGMSDGVLATAFGISAVDTGVLEPDYALGDSNGDEAINILDLISLKNAILNNDAYVSYRDMNTDKQIDALDLTELKKVIFNAF